MLRQQDRHWFPRGPHTTLGTAETTPHYNPSQPQRSPRDPLGTQQNFFGFYKDLWKPTFTSSETEPHSTSHDPPAPRTRPGWRPYWRERDEAGHYRVLLITMEIPRPRNTPLPPPQLRLLLLQARPSCPTPAGERKIRCRTTRMLTQLMDFKRVEYCDVYSSLLPWTACSRKVQ